MKHRLLCAVALMACLGAHAKDYGVLGEVMPIIEKDIRQLMAESASRADWSQAQEAVKDSAKTYLSRLPKRQFPVTDHTLSWYVDPSLVLASDIQAPIKGPDGNFSWQILHRKGTKVNPLQYARPVTAMLFFDGSQPDQVQLVKKVLDMSPDRIVPVEAGAGDLNASGDVFDRPVFYASDAMVNKFQLRYLPSLVYPGDGDKSLYLGVTAFAMPYSATAVLQVWSGTAQLVPASVVRLPAKK